LQRSRDINLGLMRALARSYAVFHAEPNLEHSDGSCVEFGLVLREGPRSLAEAPGLGALLQHTNLTALI
jgi:hypothetical protein